MLAKIVIRTKSNGDSEMAMDGYAADCLASLLHAFVALAKDNDVSVHEAVSLLVNVYCKEYEQ